MTDTPNADSRAGWEDLWRTGNYPPRFASFADPEAKVAAWAQTLTPESFVLDVGCGTGRHLVYLGALGMRLAGVDISPSGVQMTQDACAARGFAVDARVTEMTTLPWADATFDAALSTATIHHARRADVQRALDEVWRILKPGGLFLVDFPHVDTSDYQLLRGLVAQGLVQEPEPNTFIDDRDDDPYDDDGWLPHHFCDAADLHDLLARFTLLKVTDEITERDSPRFGRGRFGKWVVWAQRPSHPA